MSAPPSPNLDLEESLEATAFSMEELSILAGLWFADLEKIMNDLGPGRSPQAIGLGDRLEALQELSDAFESARLDAENALQGLKKFSSHQEVLQAMTGWEQEHQFWQGWQDQMVALQKKLNLISDQSQLTSLGRLPLEDLWEEIRSIS